MNWNNQGNRGWQQKGAQGQAIINSVSGQTFIGGGDFGRGMASWRAASADVADARQQGTFSGALDTMRSGMDFGPMGSRTSSGGLGFSDPKDGLNLVKTKAIAGFGSSVGPTIFAQKKGGGGGGGGGVKEKPEDKHKREMEMEKLKQEGIFNLQDARFRGEAAQSFSNYLRGGSVGGEQWGSTGGGSVGGEGGESIFSGVDSMLKD